MKLTELEPQFLRYELLEGKETHRYVDTLADAQGVMFLCPQCWKKNNGPVGTHSVLCWFVGRRVPDHVFPRPGRWHVSGTGYDDLTLQPSVFLTGQGCGWHGFVTNGVVTTC